MLRQEILRRLYAQIDSGRPIVAAGAGIGLAARAEQKGGVDLIVVYNSGRYRMAGRGSTAGLLPYGDANAIVVEMGAEILPVVRDTPVLAGICGTDPFREMRPFLTEIKRLGFSGVQNFPTVGLFDGRIRTTLEETGMGYELEVDMIAAARTLDLFTMTYVFTPKEARAMTEAGSDVIVPHLGATAGGELGVRTTFTLERACEEIQKMRDAVVEVNPEAIVLCHGGPLAHAEDFAYVLTHTRGVVGYLGASTIERDPVQTAIADAVQSFKNLSLDGRGSPRRTPNDT